MQPNTIDSNELKKIMLEILDEIKEYCDSAGIQFYLTGGTLLGAVRHKGFIPWDDDIDVILFREDYEKFVKGFKSKSGKVKIVSMHSEENCRYAFAKAIDDTTVLIEDGNEELAIGVYVDVFPLDSMCDDLQLCNKIARKAHRCQLVHQMKYMFVSKERSFVKNLCLVLARPILRLFPDSFFFAKFNKIIDRYKKNQNSKYVTNFCGAWVEKEITERKNFSSAVELEFEGRKMPGPIGYDAFLRGLYNDYMKLPPKEKQVGHHDIIAYRK